MEDWLHNPNKKQLGLYSAIWFICMLLIVLSATNFFTESVLVRKNLLFLLIVIYPTLILIRMIRNYIIHNKNETNSTHFQNL